MELPLCFTCKHCKLARKKDTLENVWKIKCKLKIFAFKVSMNYPQYVNFIKPFDERKEFERLGIKKHPKGLRKNLISTYCGKEGLFLGKF